ncbi:gag-pol polyprotein [Cucumis melo var. makuwa]|uniref:Gag-pol polyprotein n=1 Tax=Cucumis melo var. makuwa TaxID=1194695 RepID=A0A5D3CH33_CUCMM|nr:gag-pol polyprotein [Cucumis melo var. makuwa]
MTELETIAEFNVRVLDIANESDALGEKMSGSKLVQKVIGSLPVKFNMKVTAIEEANDLSKIKLDKLFGSLRTFELHLGEGANRKKPGMALTSVKEELTEEHQVSQNKDSLAKSMRKDYERGEKDYGTSKSEKNDNENYSRSDDEEVGMTLISISTIDEEGVERVHP